MKFRFLYVYDFFFRRRVKTVAGVLAEQVTGRCCGIIFQVFRALSPLTDFIDTLIVSVYPPGSISTFQARAQKLAITGAAVRTCHCQPLLNP